MEQVKKTHMLDDERGLIVLEATWGIDALAILTIKALEDEDSEEVLWATKEVLKRVRQLNSVIMSAVGDNEDNDALRKRT
ncbi:hypothetical protein C8R31_106130 [Nitrosospira sp. Nsp2]|nr:hypothetical protein C8R31_106130 [Nitrosospira sp. Nsp2]